VKFFYSYLLIISFLIFCCPSNSDAMVFTIDECLHRILVLNRNLVTQHENVISSQNTLTATKSEFDFKIIPSGGVGLQGGSDELSRSSYTGGLNLSKKLPWGTEILASPRVAHQTGDTSSVSTSAKFSISQPLLRGLGVEYAYSSVYSSEFSLRSTQRNYYLSQVSTALRAIRVAYAITGEQQQVVFRQDSVNRLRELANVARIKREIGAAQPEDVYRAEQQLKQAKSALLGNVRRLSQFQDELKTLMGLGQAMEVSVTTPLNIPELDIDPEQAEEIALSQRLEIEQALDELREKNRLSRVARNNIWPELNIVVGYLRYDQDEAFGRAVNMNQDSWGVSLVSTTDFFRTTEKISYQESLTSIEQAKRSIQTLRDTIAKEVKESFRQLADSHENISLQLERLNAARQQLELSRIKFKYGMANNFDLLDAEDVYTSSQQAHQAALISAIVGSYELQAALGILFQDMIIKPQLASHDTKN
jgi:outer membrane protein TolC